MTARACFYCVDEDTDERGPVLWQQDIWADAHNDCADAAIKEAEEAMP